MIAVRSEITMRASNKTNARCDVIRPTVVEFIFGYRQDMTVGYDKYRFWANDHKNLRAIIRRIIS